MIVENKIYEEFVRITKSHKPNECCCLLFKTNTIIEDVTHKAKSLSPGHFGEIDPEYVGELITKHGTPTAIFHSHPCEAFVSSTDFQYMIPTVMLWRCVWLIMSDQYKMKAFTLTKDSSLFNGFGVKELPIEHTCARCHGYGEIEYKPRNDPAETTEIRGCSTCMGSGKCQTK